MACWTDSRQDEGEGIVEKPECPEAQEYLQWFEEEASPHLRKLYAHILKCPSCREIMLEGKDTLAYAVLAASDGEVIEEIRKF